mmetsp:Transcript_1657/g.5168  ORF Transcript_1657/g.5168 Transcript_1657/m.5168 type:complete len:307 (-) Transcript_1657:156-1076(-)
MLSSGVKTTTAAAWRASAPLERAKPLPGCPSSSPTPWPMRCSETVEGMSVATLRSTASATAAMQRGTTMRTASMGRVWSTVKQAAAKCSVTRCRRISRSSCVSYCTGVECHGHAAAAGVPGASGTGRRRVKVCCTSAMTRKCVFLTQWSCTAMSVHSLSQCRIAATASSSVTARIGCWSRSMGTYMGSSVCAPASTGPRRRRRSASGCSAGVAGGGLARQGKRMGCLVSTRTPSVEMVAPVAPSASTMVGSASTEKSSASLALVRASSKGMASHGMAAKWALKSFSSESRLTSTTSKRCPCPRSRP